MQISERQMVKRLPIEQRLFIFIPLLHKFASQTAAARHRHQYTLVYYTISSIDIQRHWYIMAHSISLPYVLAQALR
jgi:hypothetical protein